MILLKLQFSKMSIITDNQLFLITDIYHFQMPLIHLFSVIIAYWVIAKSKRTWSLVPVLQIAQKIPENYCSCLVISIGQVS